MPIIITLKDIEEAIDNLNYRSETTLKSKLVRAVRIFYLTESSVEALTSIDMEQLIKIVWDTGEDAQLIKSKKKNFSSLKSSVNCDLKKLYAEGKNPQGIIIGHNNIFDISDEAKDKALSHIADIFQEKGNNTQSKITDIIATLNNVLSSEFSKENAEEACEEIERLKNLVDKLSGKPVLPVSEESIPGKVNLQEETGTKADDGAGITTIEPEEREGQVRKEGISNSLQHNAQTSIADILQDKGIDSQSKISKIMAELQGILSDTISSVSADLNNEEVAQIKSYFGDLTETRKSELAQDSSSGRYDNPAGVTDVTREQIPEELGSLSNIMNSVNDMLNVALAADGLRSEDAGRIKNLFVKLTNNIKSALSSGQSLDNIGIESGREAAGGAALEGVAEEIAGLPDEAVIEEIVEVIEEESVAGLDGETGVPIEELALSEENSASEAGREEIPADQYTGIQTAAEELDADEVVEIVEKVESDEIGELTGDGELAANLIPSDIAGSGLSGEDGDLTGAEHAEDEQTSAVDVSIPGELGLAEESRLDNSSTLSLESLPVDTLGIEEEVPAEEIATVDEIVDAAEALDEEFLTEHTMVEGEHEELIDMEVYEEAIPVEDEEIIEEIALDKEELSAQQSKTAGETVEGDLQSKADILAELAAAAKALEKIGPDLNSSIYSEEEIREKAKFLAEEFDRYLSVREKFYNQHILIKGGNYLVGGAHRCSNEVPEQIVNLRDFYIGKFPVTNALFEIFVEKTGYITTAEKYGFGMVYVPRMQKTKSALTGAERFIWNGQLQHKRIPGACWYKPHGGESTLYIKRTHPVVQVSLEDACAFAAWTGKRIPTEQEWEAAARTSCGYLYPWGNVWQDDCCNMEKSLWGDTTPVDQYVKFANEYELADALGNVLEWTLDCWREPVPGEEREENYIVKGASWISDSEVCLADRQPVNKEESSNILGFRCIAI